MKYDVVSFGSATLDVFIKPDTFLLAETKEFTAQKALCFPFGSKVEVNQVKFRTGGGGANVAAGLALQGFKTAYCGAIGNDFSGNEVIKDLKKNKIDLVFLQETSKAPTNFSAVFSLKEERTCFVWRGASELFDWKKTPKEKLKNTKWFYLAPLSGSLAFLFEVLVEFAQKNNIKIMANLGHSQLKMGKKLKPLLKKIEIVLLNKEEASLLTGVSYQREAELFRRLDDMIDGLAIMTKGRQGVSASNGEFLWEAKALPVETKEKTGAGDAFASGFLSSYLRTDNVSSALQLGVANASACLKAMGAKQGLLKKGDKYKRVRVSKEKI